jgi:PAS domain S-box-containing protein
LLFLDPVSASSAIIPFPDDASRIDLLSDLTQSLNLGRSLEEVFDLIYERLRRFVPYNRIAVAVTDPACRRLSILVARSDGKMVLGNGYSGPVLGSSLEPLLRSGRPRILNDLRAYLERKPSSESTRLIVREGMRSSFTLPLLVQGKPVGVMFFSSRQAGVYAPEHEEFLRGVAGHMAIVIERTRLVDELREKTEYLESILNNSAEAIIVTDVQNRIRTWNEGARRIFGYEADEAVGKDAGMLLPSEGGNGSEEQRSRDAEREQAFVPVEECETRTKDGRRVLVSGTSSVLRDKKGRVIGRSSILRDVTEMKRLQEELSRARSMAAVGELAATVAHEIKNPLAGISGAVQILRETMPEDDSRRQTVAEILEQIRRLDRTVRDLLIFARPATPVRQEVDLGETLRRAWALVAPPAEAAGVRFAVDGAEGVLVSADPQLLQQVWVNLFQNAIEAMSQGGELRVRVLPEAGRVRVEVRDSGPGIDPAHLGSVFKPFFSTKVRGTGLGLAISRKIVEAHGGRIGLSSAPGRGTTVSVEIPR